MSYQTRPIHSDIISAVNHAVPDDPAFYQNMARFFKNFSDQTRLRIIFALLSSEMCVSDIAIALDMQHSAISHQLAKMMRSGLISKRRGGKTVYYSINANAVAPILKSAFDQLDD